VAITSAPLTNLKALLGQTAVLAHDRTMPVGKPFEDIIPGAVLVRGQVVSLCGLAEVSLALAMAAPSTQLGSWLVVVEHPDRFEVGAGAADELGVVVDRTVIVSLPADPALRFADVVATLIEGFDVVIVSAELPLSPAAGRRLQARLRTRGGVVMVVGGSGCWQPDLVLRSAAVGPQGGWQSLHDEGRLRSRQIVVEVEGRRQGATHRHRLWLPGSDAGVARVDDGTPSSRRRDHPVVASAG
jgi:hypothetical protein